MHYILYNYICKDILIAARALRATDKETRRDAGGWKAAEESRDLKTKSSHRISQPTSRGG